MNSNYYTNKFSHLYRGMVFLNELFLYLKLIKNKCAIHAKPYKKLVIFNIKRYVNNLNVQNLVF